MSERKIIEDGGKRYVQKGECITPILREITAVDCVRYGYAYGNIFGNLCEVEGCNNPHTCKYFHLRDEQKRPSECDALCDSCASKTFMECNKPESEEEDMGEYPNKCRYLGERCKKSRTTGPKCLRGNDDCPEYESEEKDMEWKDRCKFWVQGERWCDHAGLPRDSDCKPSVATCYEKLKEKPIIDKKLLDAVVSREFVLKHACCQEDKDLFDEIANGRDEVPIHEVLGKISCGIPGEKKISVIEWLKKHEALRVTTTTSRYDAIVLTGKSLIIEEPRIVPKVGATYTWELSGGNYTLVAVGNKYCFVIAAGHGKGEAVVCDKDNGGKRMVEKAVVSDMLNNGEWEQVSE